MQSLKGKAMNTYKTRAARAASLRVRPLAAAPALLAAIAAAALSLAPSATAASGLLVIPRPAGTTGLSYFKVDAVPDSTQQVGAIELRNEGSAPVTAAISAVDGKTLGTLGSGYAAPGSKPHRSTLWVHLASDRVTVAAHASATVPVAIDVPASAPAGDYLSGVTVESLNQGAQGLAKQGVSIASVERYAIGVEMLVPGPRVPLIRFTGAAVGSQPAGLQFTLKARNYGNAILQGVYGHVEITEHGRAVVSRKIEPGTFVTHSGIDYPVPVKGLSPKEGTHFGVIAYLKYPGGIARLDTEVTFGHAAALFQQRYYKPAAVPPSNGTSWWKVGLIGAAILYGLFTTLLLFRRRRREEEPATAS